MYGSVASSHYWLNIFELGWEKQDLWWLEPLAESKFVFNLFPKCCHEIITKGVYVACFIVHIHKDTKRKTKMRNTKWELNFKWWNHDSVENENNDGKTCLHHWKTSSVFTDSACIIKAVNHFFRPLFSASYTFVRSPPLSPWISLPQPIILLWWSETSSCCVFDPQMMKWEEELFLSACSLPLFLTLCLSMPSWICARFSACR